MKKTSLILFILLFISVFGASVFAQDVIKIAGDPCSVPLAKRLGEEFGKDTGIKVETLALGCTKGASMSAEGGADIGVSTHNEISGILPEGAFIKAIAKAPIVMIVNKENPVNNLSTEEIKGIFSGTIRNWKEVGGMDAEILNILLPPCVKKSMSETVSPYGDIKELKPEGKVNPVEYTNTLVSANIGAIGPQIYGYESKDVKVLTVEGLLPEGGNGYKFYQDYNIVTKETPQNNVKKFIDFALSPKGRDIIKGLKHIPL